MDPRPVFVAQFALNLCSYALVLWWFVWPRLWARDRHAALLPLVFAHCVRTLGPFAIVPGIAGERVAHSTWAHHVAIGDLVTVVLALITVAALRRRHRYAIALAWVFNVFGSLDVINAGYNAVREQIIPDAGAQMFVIGFGVPMLVVTHVAIFVLLLRHRPSGDPP